MVYPTPWCPTVTLFVYPSPWDPTVTVTISTHLRILFYAAKTITASEKATTASEDIMALASEEVKAALVKGKTPAAYTASFSVCKIPIIAIFKASNFSISLSLAPLPWLSTPMAVPTQTILAT